MEVLHGRCAGLDVHTCCATEPPSKTWGPTISSAKTAQRLTRRLEHLGYVVNLHPAA
jgi:hypothetical protein